MKGRWKHLLYLGWGSLLVQGIGSFLGRDAAYANGFNRIHSPGDVILYFLIAFCPVVLFVLIGVVILIIVLLVRHSHKTKKAKETR